MLDPSIGVKHEPAEIDSRASAQADRRFQGDRSEITVPTGRAERPGQAERSGPWALPGFVPQVSTRLSSFAIRTTHACDRIERGETRECPSR